MPVVPVRLLTIEEYATLGHRHLHHRRPVPGRTRPDHPPRL